MKKLPAGQASQPLPQATTLAPASSLAGECGQNVRVLVRRSDTCRFRNEVFAFAAGPSQQKLYTWMYYKTLGKDKLLRSAEIDVSTVSHPVSSHAN